MRTHTKEKSKSTLLALCEGNSSVMGEFPAQRASNAGKASIWWRHYAYYEFQMDPYDLCTIILQGWFTGTEFSNFTSDKYAG